MRTLKTFENFPGSGLPDDGEDWRSDLTRKITKEDIIDIIKSNTAEDAADEILEIMSIMTSTTGR